MCCLEDLPLNNTGKNKSQLNDMPEGLNLKPQKFGISCGNHLLNLCGIVEVLH